MADLAPADDLDAAPPVGTASPVVTPPADDETTERTYSAAEMRAVKNEARNLRDRLRKIEAQIEAHPAALEAATREAEALRSQAATTAERLRGYVLRDAIAAAGADDDAADLRVSDPVAAARLIEGVEWGDDGAPKNVPAALRRLLRQHPVLAAQPPARAAQPAAGGGKPPRADVVAAHIQSHYAAPAPRKE